MNNRFRFRVFDKEKNNYVDDSEVELILHNDGVLLFGNWHEDIKVVEQDKYIIEQCADVRDKNGKLVYEGDLLGGLPVVWVNELNGFMVKVNTIRGWNWRYINEFTYKEVTGNIHEAEQKEQQ